jgi:hypothetical protein
MGMGVIGDLREIKRTGVLLIAMKLPSASGLAL